MSTAIAGHSLDLRQDFLQLAKLLRDHCEMVETSVREHRGEILQRADNSFLLGFSSPLDALRCAFAIEKTDTAYGQSEKRFEKIHLRVGLHLGRPDLDESGKPGANLQTAIAAQQLAEPGEVCASDAFFRSVSKVKGLVSKPKGTYPVGIAGDSVVIHSFVPTSLPQKRGLLSRRNISIGGIIAALGLLFGFLQVVFQI
jgi:adenylate cyclase